MKKLWLALFLLISNKPIAWTCADFNYAEFKSFDHWPEQKVLIANYTGPWQSYSYTEEGGSGGPTEDLGWFIVDDTFEPKHFFKFSYDADYGNWTVDISSTLANIKASRYQPLIDKSEDIKKAILKTPVFSTQISDTSYDAFRDEIKSKAAFERKILNEALNLNPISIDKDCGVKEIKKPKLWRLTFFDPETKNDITFESIDLTPENDYSDPDSYSLTGCLPTEGKEKILIIRHADMGFGVTSTEYLQKFNPDRIAYAIHNIKGFRLLQEKKIPEAEKLFRESVALNPEYVHANFNLACSLALQNKPFSEGRPFLDKTVEDERRRKKYLRKIKTDADLTAWRNDPEFMAWILRTEKATENDDLSIDGLDYEEKSKYLEARAAFDLGMQTYMAEKYSDSAVFFAEALYHNPKYLSAEMNLASVSALLGYREDALFYLRNVLIKNRELARNKMLSDSDFKRLKDDPVFKRWLEITSPSYNPLPKDNKWLIDPKNQIFGPLSTSFTEEDLIKTFGAANVTRKQWAHAQGNEVKIDSQHALNVWWYGSTARSWGYSISKIGGFSPVAFKNKWILGNGIKLGMTLDEMLILSGRSSGGIYNRTKEALTETTFQWTNEVTFILTPPKPLLAKNMSVLSREVFDAHFKLATFELNFGILRAQEAKQNFDRKWEEDNIEWQKKHWKK